MQRAIVKSTVAVIISFLFASLVYASNHITYEAPPKNYIIRVTSQNPSVSVPFTGSYMTSLNSGSKIARIDKATPFEVEEKANALDFMFMVVKENVDSFKVEILEKDRHGEHLRLQGTAASEYGLISTNGLAIIGS